MPTMPLDILSVFNNDNSVVVFDVGGDDDGALALGQYKHLTTHNYLDWLRFGTSCQ